MKSRRKIWSLPLALVTALLLVGLLGAAVLAQSSRNAAPSIASLDDFKTRIGNTAESIDLTEEISDATMVDGTGTFDGADVTVQVPEQLAVTVMVLEPGRTTVALETSYNGDTGPGSFAPVTNEIADFDHDDDAETGGITITVPSAVAVWWDRLTQAQRRAPVGAVLIDNTETDAADKELCDNDSWCFDFNHDGDDGTTDTVRRIRNYVAVVAGTGVGPIDALVEAQMAVVTRAFHWDMLDDAEMKAVAKAAGYDNYDNYGKRFGALGTEA